MSEPILITSRDNPLLQRLRRLVQDGAAYRRGGSVWLEGEHLCSALRERGLPAAQAVVRDDAFNDPALAELASWAAKVVRLPAPLFASISGLESPARLGFVLDLPPAPAVQGALSTLVLDRLQDPGNVGSILRSAAAFGVQQVLALKGTVALWSPKVLRAGMGAHFALHLVEGLDEAALQSLQVPMLGTSSHAGTPLTSTVLPWPCAWLLGHEGQGVSAPLMQRCAMLVCIPQPGGEESLNVAAAAAVCLYESSRQAAGAAQGQ